jgi:hypothetical protein
VLGFTRRRCGEEKIRLQVKAAVRVSEWLTPRSCKLACEVKVLTG